MQDGGRIGDNGAVLFDGQSIVSFCIKVDGRQASKEATKPRLMM